MPKYFLLDRHFLKSNSEVSASQHEPGETIDFSGAPGASMVALDNAAAEAKAVVDKSRPPGALRDARLSEARGRARLNSSQRKLVAEAEAKIAKQ